MIYCMASSIFFKHKKLVVVLKNFGWIFLAITICICHNHMISLYLNTKEIVSIISLIVTAISSYTNFLLSWTNKLVEIKKNWPSNFRICIENLSGSSQRISRIFEMISVVNQLIIVILVISIFGFVKSDLNEICSAYSGRRIYLDENGSGAIQAANVTASTLKNVRKLFYSLFFQW